MTDDELDRIRYSFVPAVEGCKPEVATLLTILKYYGVNEVTNVEQLTEWCNPDEEGYIGFLGMGEAVKRLGMKYHLLQMDMEMLEGTKLPVILYMWNELEAPVYMVCYGLHNGRYIVWDAEWGGPMHYWPDDMKEVWIDGIALRLYPTHELMSKADFHHKWWQLYPSIKKWKRRWDNFREFIDLEVYPLFRW